MKGLLQMGCLRWWAASSPSEPRRRTSPSLMSSASAFTTALLLLLSILPSPTTAWLYDPESQQNISAPTSFMGTPGFNIPAPITGRLYEVVFTDSCVLSQNKPPPPPGSVVLVDLAQIINERGRSSGASALSSTRAFKCEHSLKMILAAQRENVSAILFVRAFPGPPDRLSICELPRGGSFMDKDCPSRAEESKIKIPIFTIAQSLRDEYLEKARRPNFNVTLYGSETDEWDAVAMKPLCGVTSVISVTLSAILVYSIYYLVTFVKRNGYYICAAFKTMFLVALTSAVILGYSMAFTVPSCTVAASSRPGQRRQLLRVPTVYYPYLHIACWSIIQVAYAGAMYVFLQTLNGFSVRYPKAIYKKYFHIGFLAIIVTEIGLVASGAFVLFFRVWAAAAQLTIILAALLLVAFGGVAYRLWRLLNQGKSFMKNTQGISVFMRITICVLSGQALFLVFAAIAGGIQLSGVWYTPSGFAAYICLTFISHVLLLSNLVYVCKYALERIPMMKKPRARFTVLLRKSRTFSMISTGMKRMSMFGANGMPGGPGGRASHRFSMSSRTWKGMSFGSQFNGSQFGDGGLAPPVPALPSDFGSVKSDLAFGGSVKSEMGMGGTVKSEMGMGGTVKSESSVGSAAMTKEKKKHMSRVSFVIPGETLPSFTNGEKVTNRNTQDLHNLRASTFGSPNTDSESNTTNNNNNRSSMYSGPKNSRNNPNRLTVTASFGGGFTAQDLFMAVTNDKSNNSHSSSGGGYGNAAGKNASPSPLRNVVTSDGNGASGGGFGGSGMNGNDGYGNYQQQSQNTSDNYGFSNQAPPSTYSNTAAESFTTTTTTKVAKHQPTTSGWLPSKPLKGILKSRRKREEPKEEVKDTIPKGEIILPSIPVVSDSSLQRTATELLQHGGAETNTPSNPPDKGFSPSQESLLSPITPL
ncbi:hypothetical protein HK102_002309, partial [Quaeritorhiza haematococci]